MNFSRIARSITTYFIYSITQYLILLLAVQYSKFEITSQLVLTFIQALLVLFAFSAHLSLYANDQRWHWITPSTIHEWIFPENKQIPYSELSVYFQLFFCTLILAATVTATHILCHFSHITHLLFMLGRLGIGTFTLLNTGESFFPSPLPSQNTKANVVSSSLLPPKAALFNTPPFSSNEADPISTARP